LRPLFACRTEADPAKRLACYDKAAETLDTAAERRDIVVVDRAEAQKTRRSLFGFAIPSLKIFDSDRSEKSSPADPEEDQISTTIRSARQDADGYWILTMEDGAVWHQTGGTLFVRPKAGGVATIRRAALGSYFLRIGSGPGVKARRES
jgi:hypothetical protein